MANDNIAPDATPTCDSFYSAGFECDKAIDEDLVSRWVSGAGQPHQIELDWGEDKYIGEVRFYAEGMGGEKFTEYYIEYYDGSWHEVVHVTGFDTWAEWVSHEATFTCTKIRFRTTAGDTNTGLNELEAYLAPPPAFLSGTIKEKGSPVVRTVRAYVRSTGAFFSSGESNPDGTFSLAAPDDATDMYVIALDDEAGPQYNALIFDRVRGVSS